VALMGDTNKEDRVYSLLIDDNTRWQQTKMNKTYFFYLNKDFMMPLNSTLEELAERENLLRSYYDF
jgi:hypothetical protein